MSGLIEGSTKAFRISLDQLERGLAGIKSVDVYAEGQDEKVAAANRRGDYFLKDPLLAVVVVALEDVWGENMTPGQVVDALEKATANAMRWAIEDGLAQGPTRKTQNRTGKKLYDTGDLLRGLVGKVVR